MGLLICYAALYNNLSVLSSYITPKLANLVDIRPQTLMDGYAWIAISYVDVRVSVCLYPS